MAQTDEFVITRTFNAPRNLVYEAWSKPEHFAKWWGPAGFELEVSKFDFKPGGQFHYSMTMGEHQMWGLFSYREMTPPEKIVFVSSFSNATGEITRAPFDPNFPLEIQNIVTFEEKNGKTTITLKGGPINAKPNEMDFFRTMFGSMQQGFGGTFDKLDAFLKALN